MPAYGLELRPAARRDLERLSPLLLERVDRRIRKLADDPRPHGSEKMTGLSAYRVRVGDHRIVYEVDDRRRVVTVTRIRHRRDVYRRLR